METWAEGVVVCRGRGVDALGFDVAPKPKWCWNSTVMVGRRGFRGPWKPSLRNPTMVVVKGLDVTLA